MGVIGKKIGKTVMKSLKVVGVRSDDITGMIEEFEIDSLIADEILKLQEKNNVEEIVITGKVNENGNLIFQAINKNDLTQSFDIDFFGIKKDSFSISNIVIELIKLAFEGDKKEKKKKKK